MRDLCFVDDFGEFLGPQQRHGAHADAARLEYRHPGRRHHRIVRAAQQHAVAGLESHLAHQQVGHAVGLRQQLRVGAFAIGSAERDAIAVAGAHHVVEQDSRAIHALRILQFRQLEMELRPLVPGWQVVARERIDVGRADHCFNYPRTPVSFSPRRHCTRAGNPSFPCRSPAPALPSRSPRPRRRSIPGAASSSS